MAQILVPDPLEEHPFLFAACLMIKAFSIGLKGLPSPLGPSSSSIWGMSRELTSATGQKLEGKVAIFKELRVEDEIMKRLWLSNSAIRIEQL